MSIFMIEFYFLNMDHTGVHFDYNEHTLKEPPVYTRHFFHTKILYIQYVVYFTGFKKLVAAYKFKPYIFSSVLLITSWF